MTFYNLNLADYLQPSETELSIELAKFIVEIQTRMIREVKCNFPNEHASLICDLCEEQCNQQHLLECKQLLGGNELLTYIPDYGDIFDGDLEEKLYIGQLMMNNLLRKRQHINLTKT